jgi:hypothetical protein
MDILSSVQFILRQWKLELHDSGYTHAIGGYNPVRHLKMRRTEKISRCV